MYEDEDVMYEIELSEEHDLMVRKQRRRIYEVRRDYMEEGKYGVAIKETNLEK